MNFPCNDPLEPPIQGASDARLWDQVLNGEQPAFEQIVARYQGVVSGVAYSHVGNFAWCQEVTQETFWQAWRQREQLRDRERLGPWLCGIARNLARQAYRHERGTGIVSLSFDPPMSQLDPQLALISEEERVLVWQELETIPEIYREPLVLFYREGMSIAAVAKLLELNADTVKQRLSRGRDRLRNQLANKIEEVLIRSRPGRTLTKSIMVGIGVLSTTAKATASASAAGIGTSVGQSVVGTGTALAAKAVVGGASVGLAGGLIGTLAGLLGAGLGIWVPAQMAATSAERKFLMREGRQTIGVVCMFTLAVLACSLMLGAGASPFLFWVLLTSISTGFTFYIIFRTLSIQSAIMKIREQVSPLSDPNPSKFRQQMKRLQGRGRSYTSPGRLLGIPWLDIQFGNSGLADDGISNAKRAFGWIALGDRATGILFGYGGFATGLFALGGISCGVFAAGGLAMGGLALGGGAVGLIALGGGAIGYDAAGGAAIGWHSAAGGGAMAEHVAVGGAALARDFAVGGAAAAQEVNTELAHSIAAQESYSWILDWIVANQFAFHAGCILLMAVCMLFQLLVIRVSPTERVVIK